LSDAKKTGSRDISELKQRLGLKKGAAAPAATTSQTRSNGSQSGGVVPPPGLSLPPPPGLAPAAPPPPPMPNAHDDPFGAMNAMAAQHIPQRAPEIVIVHDGKPVENVGAESHASTLLKIAVPAVVALIVGITVGKVGTSAASYNDGLKGAKAVLGDKTTPSTVAFLKKSLSDLDTALDEAKTKKGFKPDLALDKTLKEMAQKLEVKSELVFRAKENSLDAEVAGQILSFYAGVTEIKDMIDQHNKAALGDDMSLKKGKDAADATDAAAVGGQFKYGVLIQSPTETDKSDFGAKVVILAGVYCGGASPVANCAQGESPSAFAYQNDPGSTPIKGDYVREGSDNVPTKKIIPLLQNGVRDSLIKGGEPTVSEYYYTRRVRAIYDRIHGKPGQDGKATGGLLDDGNKLETRLQQEANKGSRFSFFM
jgi:hypothetical protein